MLPGGDRIAVVQRRDFEEVGVNKSYHNCNQSFKVTCVDYSAKT